MGAFHRHLSKLDRRWRHRYSTLRNLWWRNVSLAVRHFLACSYNLCSLLSVCNVIALFLTQARPTDDYHLPSIYRYRGPRKDRAGQFYREMTTKGSRVVNRQRKLRGKDPAKPSYREIPRNVAKVNFAPSLSRLRCRKFALKRHELPEVV